MWTDLHWVDGPWLGRLAISARPRGGDWLADEIASWKAAGVTVVVSLLEAAEQAALDLDQERRICEQAGVEFYWLPVADRGVPAASEATHWIEKLRTELGRGQGVNIHCRQGIGRSAMMAAAFLVESGLPPDVAVAQVARARGVPVPETREQRRWIDQFAAAFERRG